MFSFQRKLHKYAYETCKDVWSYLSVIWLSEHMKERIKTRKASSQVISGSFIEITDRSDFEKV